MGDIRVLIVDDSPVVSRILEQGLSAVRGIRVIGMAPNPYVARDLIVQDPPDVVTLDIEMPRMDGLTFLRKLMMHFPLPVIVVSTLTGGGSRKAIEALELGAVDVVDKNLCRYNPHGLILELAQKVRAASTASVRQRGIAANQLKTGPATRGLPAAVDGRHHVIAIGSSTGGTEALATLLGMMPANAPGTVIVQHLPANFTGPLAQRLDGLSAMNVREARNGDRILPGLALLSPGDRHLLVAKHGAELCVELRDGPRVNWHKPSVDVLFHTVAKNLGSRAIGVMLTGMGNDGAAGMLAMKESGAYNLAQDEASCVVYGMPRAAVENGAAHEVVPLEKMAERVCRAVSNTVRA